LQKACEITALADVRSRPYSRYLPHFAKHVKGLFCEADKIRYVFCGQELARPEDQNCHVDGVKLYTRELRRLIYIGRN
jgi:hypothetical protein